MKTDWIKRKREELHLSQDELAAQLQVEGYDVSRAAVSHWENGKYNPPLDNPEFVRSIARILKMSVNGVLIEAGYPIQLDDFSEAARRAADIVNQLPSTKQSLALGILEQLLTGG